MGITALLPPPLLVACQRPVLTGHQHQRRGRWGVGVVRRYPVGVGRAAWEQCRMVMLVLELSAGRWLSSNDWAQTEQHRMGILQASSPS
ncbi:Uncharacterised protein [Mycobacterium tuberculosis]|nr:Uncharacterised protein [Mycobacterium tuberculosis]